MALFKVCRGNETNLPSTKNDGYAYFCTDTGNFFIDWASANGTVNRVQINSDCAYKLRYQEDGEYIEIDASAVNAHINSNNNPHGVTKSQIGLGNVDNTSDDSKPVSSAQATAIADAKKAGTDAQSNLTAHNSDGAAHSDIRTTLNQLSTNKAAADHTHTAAEVGAAASSHNHSAANITSGTLSVARGGTGVTTDKAIALKAYPVNSIYMSVNSTSPASLFGGTWTQLKDRFLLGAGSTYTNGKTGGAATVTLTENEIPEHGHDIEVLSGATGTGAYYMQPPATNNSGSWARAQTLTTGGSKAHDNMPPYLVVYMWKRTA